MRCAIRQLLAGVLTVLVLPLALSPAQAQAWPTRTVHLVLTLGAGSGTDIGGRLLVDGLTRKWGQAVVIENKPGGDGIVAINAFVSAKDDHVLLLSPTSAFIAHPWVHDNLPYRPEDLAPIARISNTFVGITVPVVSPANTLDELAALVRAKPGELNWAGVTGANAFMFEAWLKANKLDMKKIPYRNPVEAGRDLAENRVQTYQSAVAIAQPQIEAGKIKLLALLNSVRTPAYPSIPTVAEAGHPSMTIDGLVGLFGPPSMPMAQREAIAADVKAVMESDPIIKDRLTRTAQLFNPGGPAEFGASIAIQRATVTAAANALGMKARQ
jgi:tripartite-type tricarboxylate transporter receptor subunit TctC